jgi:hypothetical protein
VTFATSQVLPPRVCAFAVLRMVATRTMASNQDIADMSALITALQNRLVDLENTNSTSVAMSPTPPTHAPRDPLFKVDLCLFNGEKPLQAREFHRLAKLIPDMSPGTSEAYLINLVRSRCTEQASYWVDQWVENHKGGSYAELLAAFHAQFVASREVQTLHRIQLARAHQRPGSTVEQFYAYMAERCVGLAQPPAEIDLVTTFTYGLVDLAMRMAVASREPQTLADAYRFALEARTLISTVQSPYAQQHRPDTARLNHMGTRPDCEHPLYSPFPEPEPSEPRLQALDAATRQLCVDRRLCYRCRQPGHFMKDCPKGKSLHRGRTGGFPPRGSGPHPRFNPQGASESR